MNKVTYFDVEYANTRNKSICQMGLMCESFSDGEPVYPERDIYINPEDSFDAVCTSVHGISENKVKSELTFDKVWPEIEKFFTNSVIIGHNVASSDLDALVKALRRYNLDIPEMYYLCTYELAREYIPQFAVKNYGMGTLCEYFGIDIDSEHNAFDDACACADLLKALVREYNIDVDVHVKKYVPHETRAFSRYMSNAELRKAVCDFYGVIRGFSIDSVINSTEIENVKKWKNEFSAYGEYEEIRKIADCIDQILSDERVTSDEMLTLQSVVKSYLDVVSTSPVTLATQILNGILKGITIDGEVSAEECKNLRQWLYDNIYLSDHYPFDKTMQLIDKVLEDSIITEEESAYVTSVINAMLNPVATLSKQVNSVEGKHVCLSGNFAYGTKSEVEKYIANQGGIIDTSVKKSTDILMIGDCECQAYAHGTYGTKVKKAMEYNKKGCTIQIVKEADYFCK